MICDIIRFDFCFDEHVQPQVTQAHVAGKRATNQRTGSKTIVYSIIMRRSPGTQLTQGRQKGTENDKKKLDLKAEYGKIDSMVKNYIATVTQYPPPPNPQPRGQHHSLTDT